VNAEIVEANPQGERRSSTAARPFGPNVPSVIHADPQTIQRQSGYVGPSFKIVRAGLESARRVARQGILSSTESRPWVSISNHFVDGPVQSFRFHPPACNAVAVKLAVKTNQSSSISKLCLTR
jgi:hypothetical protein